MIPTSNSTSSSAPTGEASSGLHVVVACSGLGHVQRGIEAWARDTAVALRRRNVKVTLFSGAPTEGAIALPCLRRTGRLAIGLAKLCRHLGGWRYGADSPYEIEQLTFSITLWWKVRRNVQVLHVQDPLVGRLFERLNALHLSRARVILANGTGESDKVLGRLSTVQYLVPPPPGSISSRIRSFVVPNFIDVGLFQPGNQEAARLRFGLPKGALIILCCAAIRRGHKRIDVLIRAFELLSARRPECAAILVVAGGREGETQEIVDTGIQQLGAKVRFLVDVPRADMPDLYRAADLFVLPSLFETFGIVLIEAMATGLPVLCHDTPEFRHVVGPAGLFRNLSREEKLSDALEEIFPLAVRTRLASAARQHVVSNFSESAVVPRILAMYQSLLSVPEHANC